MGLPANGNRALPGRREEAMRAGMTMTEFMRGADGDQSGAVSKGEALAYYASKEGPVR